MTTETLSELKVGDRAPDFAFTGDHGETRRLSEFWSRQHAVLNFLRHFG
ncbi:MAG: hypothetical protein ACREQQ_09515 [Candidatus Binatia bacterium]